MNIKFKSTLPALLLIFPLLFWSCANGSSSDPTGNDATTDTSSENTTDDTTKGDIPEGLVTKFLSGATVWEGTCRFLARENGEWYSERLTPKQIKLLIANDEFFAHDWDEKWGDKLNKLVFIGQNLDKEGIKRDFDQI